MHLHLPTIIEARLDPIQDLADFKMASMVGNGLLIFSIS